MLRLTAASVESDCVVNAGYRALWQIDRSKECRRRANGSAGSRRRPASQACLEQQLVRTKGSRVGSLTFEVAALLRHCSPRFEP